MKRFLSLSILCLFILPVITRAQTVKYSTPPLCPNVTVVAGDERVTIYWDHVAEYSVDEDTLMGMDFEGYAVYRSNDGGITWGEPITNGFGEQVYWKPIAQFNKAGNGIWGTHQLEDNGIHFNLGSDDETGLNWSYTDTLLINGIKYYYAVCSFDSGSVKYGYLPTECSKNIADPYNIAEPNIKMVSPHSCTPQYIDAQVGDLNLEGNTNAFTSIRVIDPDSVTGDEYEITFDVTVIADSVGWEFTEFDTVKSLSIKNIATGQPVVADLPYFNGEEIITNGIDLTIVDVVPEIVDSLSTWKSGDCNYSYDIELYPNKGVKYGADFEIRFSDSVIDTSTLVNSQATKFQVWNISDNIKYDFLFFDQRPFYKDDSLLTIGDKIVPLLYTSPDSAKKFGTWQITWTVPPDTIINDTTEITFDTTYVDTTIWIMDPDSMQVDTTLSFFDTLYVIEYDTIKVAIDPGDGDVAHIEIMNPISSNDRFIFQTTVAYVKSGATLLLDSVKVVPNPYIVAAKWESVLDAGTRKIEFINLPHKPCTIRIYTITGELVKKIEHQADIFDSSASWDLRSDDNNEIAFGVYIYHITCEGKEAVGKFAVIK